MALRALATDFDETLADEGRVQPETLDAIRRLHEAGFTLLLVTGRILEELKQIFPDYTLFDRIIAENGALLYDPATRKERLLTRPADQRLVERLRNLSPLAVGKSIIATREPHGPEIARAIQELNLELHLILNKGAVMALPKGVTKAYGLRQALDELQMNGNELASIGDAENDQAMLEGSCLAVAVANATPELKAIADWVTSKPRGAGVRELIDLLLNHAGSDRYSHRDFSRDSPGDSPRPSKKSRPAPLR